MRSSSRLRPVVPFALLSIALLLAACAGLGAPPAQGEARAAAVERGVIEVTVGATGDVVPAARAVLSFGVAGIVGQVSVEVGDRVRLGDPLLELDPRSLGAAAAQAQAELLDAQIALKNLREPPGALALAQAEQRVLETAETVKTAQRRLDGVKYPNVADYQQTLDDALIALDNAQYQQTLTGLGGETGAVIAAQQALERAADQLGAVQTAEQGCGGCDPDRLQRAQDNYNGARNALESAQIQLQMAETGHAQSIRDAQDAVDDAQERLAAAQAGPRLSDVALAEAELATAQAEHAQAMQDLADLQAGPDDDQLAQAEARLAAAQARVDEFRLVAPFAGTVLAVNYNRGDTVTPGQTAVVVADLGSLHINTSVDELDVAHVALGQPVQIELDALPGLFLDGSVARIDLAPDPLQDTIQYPVRVELALTDQPVRIGMTAALDILVARKADVLLVPNWALQFDREQGATFVTVQRGGAPVAVPVELGLRNETVSEVLSGLQEGEQVMVVATPAPPQGGGPFGGGG